MNKNKAIYVLLLIIFVVLVLALDITFYLNYSNISGKLSIKKKFYDINYITEKNNVKLYNEAINVNVNNINEEVYFDIYNSGNENAVLENVTISSITSEVEKEKFIINSSMKEKDIIKGGETKRVYINISCESCDIENVKLAFNVKYDFVE